MNMWNKLWISFFRSWRHHFGIQFTTLLVLAGSFSVISGFICIHINAQSFLSKWGDKVQLSVYLDDEVTEVQKGAITAKLKDLNKFKSIGVITKQMAAESFQKEMADYAPDLLGDNDFGNPLPASIEAVIAPGMEAGKQIEALKQAAALVKNLAGVTDVSYGQSWVENYSALVSSFAASSWALIVILIFGSLLIVGNSIRHAISQRIEEIEILELVGATRLMIQLPYIFEGVVMGFLSASIAVSCSFMVFSWQKSIIHSELGFLGIGKNLEYMGTSYIVLIILLGMLFGGLGSYVCVRKLNSGWAAAKK